MAQFDSGGSKFLPRQSLDWASLDQIIVMALAITVFSQSLLMSSLRGALTTDETPADVQPIYNILYIYFIYVHQEYVCYVLRSGYGC